jgi:hypothetical protein
MHDVTTYRVSRFGDDVVYRIADGRVSIVGRHRVGARYELGFSLHELRPEKQVYWIRDRRPTLQVAWSAGFLLLLAATMIPASTLPQEDVVRYAPWILAALGLCLATVLRTVFPGRIEAAVFTYRSGLFAFRVPRVGRFAGQQSLFVDSLIEAIRKASADPASAAAVAGT